MPRSKSGTGTKLQVAGKYSSTPPLANGVNELSALELLVTGGEDARVGPPDPRRVGTAGDESLIQRSMILSGTAALAPRTMDAIWQAVETPFPWLFSRFSLVYNGQRGFFHSLLAARG
jgi:hypothetical protein